ncbi:MAG: hypothetical protein JST35_02525 [Armatimonadetes bacterium]|nr:hypothetical protein [Armatimonadota bacterium]
MDFNAQPITDNKRFPCAQCGAQLTFKPGLDALKCDYCGFVNHIPKSVEDIEELDFNKYLVLAASESVPDTEANVKCNSCGATFTAPPGVQSDNCPFCGSNVVVPVPAGTHLKPRSLLPFKLDKKAAMDAFSGWLAKQWLAPNDLKKYARERGGLQGMYIPYWTYDCNTTTAYSGERGIWVYRTETYTDGDGNTQTREVRETIWYPASGVVWNTFDDVLVPASNSVPEKHAAAMVNWDLPDLVPYQDAYLSGFRTERYKTGLEDGFNRAKTLMEPTILQAIRYDIGGDEQRIWTHSSQYDQITFKHILLPLWLGAYKYRDKTFSFLVNARTGEVKGDAPISFWKILLLVLIGIAIIAGFFLLKKSKGH